MKFDLVSDLHICVGDGISNLINNWVIGSDLLIMAGDIVEVAELKKNKNSIFFIFFTKFLVAFVLIFLLFLYLLFLFIF